jgi:DNA-binding IclR family transcriptional regulator
VDTTLLKGLRLFEELIKFDAPVGVSELALQLGTPKSNVHRTLTTLVHAGYVLQDASGNYYPGLRIWEQATKVVARHPVRRAANAFMYALHRETSETINLSVLDGFDCLYLHQIAAHMPIRASSNIGTRVPAIYPASGKAFLAFQPDAEKSVRAYYAKQKTKPRIKLVDLLDELATIRRTRYAISISGSRKGINSVASVIVGSHGIPVGAIAVSGPEERMTKTRMRTLSSSVLNACAQTEIALGS